MAPFRAALRLIGWGSPALVHASEGEGISLRRTALLSLGAGLSLCIAAFAANASRTGWPHAVETFYLAIALLFLPFAMRALSAGTGRTEQLANLLLLTLALFAIKMIREPTGFIDHDEFLHWSTANGIVETGRLFGENPLLPVSPLYPGLELATTALTHLSGLSVFEAGCMVLAVARLTFVGALFLTYQRICGSARIAACGCLVYMGASTFLVFDVQFSYESLAVPLVAALLLADARSQGADRARHVLVIMPVLFAALAVTHHMTGFFAAILFSGLAVLELLRRGVSGKARIWAFVTAALSVTPPLLWSHYVGNPTTGYLGPVVESGVREALSMLTMSMGRVPFVSEDGSVAPMWQRLVTVGSVGLTCLGLLLGFVRALSMAGLPMRGRLPDALSGIRDWGNSRLLLLTLVTLAFPLSIVFRLTRSGWEIGNRIGPFSFLGVGIVAAVAVAFFRPDGGYGSVRRTVLAVGALCVLVGGIISSQGPRILVPAEFQVSADSASVGPMGISFASWTKEWIGPGHVFAADRINRLLLATYGRQQVATSLQDGVDTGQAILAPTLADPDVARLRTGGVEYVTVDRRLSTGLPVVGVYFDGGANDNSYRRPPTPAALMKFDEAPRVGRAFDDGYIVTYDIRRLDAQR
ncbi:hypothetical protein [Methylobacterium sp. E-016]|uniref:hypothetical protein n=1 Tax=Methylobacterium sp. E-016 TaxID=2836556 RepID=UPI001FBBF7BE|nr:hypothetical protein [Methylobacterium sp. E-016]